MELVANYVDYNSQQSLSAVLRWCDTAGTVPLRDVADVAKRQKLLEQWTRYAVMRSIKLEMHLRGKEWETWSHHVPSMSHLYPFIVVKNWMMTSFLCPYVFFVSYNDHHRS